MTSKRIEQNEIAKSEDFDIELAISELNQSVAYLSKMILQLQRSVNKVSAKPQVAETVH